MSDLLNSEYIGRSGVAVATMLGQGWMMTWTRREIISSELVLVVFVLVCCRLM